MHRPSIASKEGRCTKFFHLRPKLIMNAAERAAADFMHFSLCAFVAAFIEPYRLHSAKRSGLVHIESILIPPVAFFAVE